MTVELDTRLLIADDHALFRDGLRSLLEAHGMQVVAEANNGWEAVELSRTCLPDVVLMDVEMPGLGGIEAAQVLGWELPDVRVVLLTASANDAGRRAAMDVGATGYTGKDATFEQLVALIVAAARHNNAREGLDRRVSNKARVVDLADTSAGMFSRLTTSERQVLSQMKTGHTSNRVLAGRLGVGEQNVRYAVRNILHKVNLHSRAELVALLMRSHWPD